MKSDIHHCHIHPIWLTAVFGESDRAWGQWLLRELHRWQVPESLIAQPTRQGFPLPELLTVTPCSLTADRSPAQIPLDCAYLVLVCSRASVAKNDFEALFAHFHHKLGAERIIVLFVDGKPGSEPKATSKVKLGWVPKAFRWRLKENFQSRVPGEPTLFNARDQDEESLSADLKLALLDLPPQRYSAEEIEELLPAPTPAPAPAPAPAEPVYVAIPLAPPPKKSPLPIVLALAAVLALCFFLKPLFSSSPAPQKEVPAPLASAPASAKSEPAATVAIATIPPVKEEPTEPTPKAEEPPVLIAAATIPPMKEEPAAPAPKAEEPPAPVATIAPVKEAPTPATSLAPIPAPVSANSEPAPVAATPPTASVLKKTTSSITFADPTPTPARAANTTSITPIGAPQPTLARKIVGTSSIIPFTPKAEQPTHLAPTEHPALPPAPTVPSSAIKPAAAE